MLGPKEGEGSFAFITSARAYKLEVLELPKDGEQLVSVRIDNGQRSHATSLRLADLGLL